VVEQLKVGFDAVGINDVDIVDGSADRFDLLAVDTQILETLKVLDF
jgi:hypothetical protein